MGLFQAELESWIQTSRFDRMFIFCILEPRSGGEPCPWWTWTGRDLPGPHSALWLSVSGPAAPCSPAFRVPLGCTQAIALCPAPSRERPHCPAVAESECRLSPWAELSSCVILSCKKDRALGKEHSGHVPCVEQGVSAGPPRGLQLQPVKAMLLPRATQAGFCSPSPRVFAGSQGGCSSVPTDTGAVWEPQLAARPAGVTRGALVLFLGQET